MKQDLSIEIPFGVKFKNLKGLILTDIISFKKNSKKIEISIFLTPIWYLELLININAEGSFKIRESWAYILDWFFDAKDKIFFF